MSTKYDKKLRKAYFDPKHPGGFGGLVRLSRETKIPLKDVKEWASRQLTYTLHKPVRKNYPREPIVVRGVDEQWSADIVDMQKFARVNKGFKYLLTIVDAFSKFGWVIPLKNKGGNSVATAFATLFSKGRKPLKIQTDKGKEFYNREVQQVFKKNHINHFSSHNAETKAQLVERFNRTLKEGMYRIFTQSNSFQYLPWLKDLVYSYNHRLHSTIGKRPADVDIFNQHEVWEKVFKKKWLARKRSSKFHFSPGDWVRISKARRVFKKGYLPGWTEEIFQIDARVPGRVERYKLREFDGEKVKGTFYSQELQKVNLAGDDIFRIEKIVKRRGKGKKKQLLVHWKGWPEKYNSWIPADQLLVSKNG